MRTNNSKKQNAKAGSKANSKLPKFSSDDEMIYYMGREAEADAMYEAYMKEHPVTKEGLARTDQFLAQMVKDSAKERANKNKVSQPKSKNGGKNSNMSDTQLIRLWSDARKKSLSKYVNCTVDTCYRTQVYGDIMDTSYLENSGHNELPKVQFVSSDTISAGIDLASSTCDKVAILNFAAGVKAGGGGETGARAQEESLCRSSNLYESLIQAKCIEGFYKYNGTTAQKNSAAIIYSPDVLFFRAGTDYHDISPIRLDVITCAASKVQLSDALQEYERRIKNILASSINNGVKNIVLGAWGCGAFHQDPVIVSKAFCNVLNEYGGYFDHIVFAILHGKNDANDNYDIFKNQFEKFYLGGI